MASGQVGARARNPELCATHHPSLRFTMRVKMLQRRLWQLGLMVLAYSFGVLQAWTLKAPKRSGRHAARPITRSTLYADEMLAVSTSATSHPSRSLLQQSKCPSQCAPGNCVLKSGKFTCLKCLNSVLYKASGQCGES